MNAGYSTFAQVLVVVDELVDSAGEASAALPPRDGKETSHSASGMRWRFRLGRSRRVDFAAVSSIGAVLSSAGGAGACSAVVLGSDAGRSFETGFAAVALRSSIGADPFGPHDGLAGDEDAVDGAVGGGVGVEARCPTGGDSVSGAATASFSTSLESAVAEVAAADFSSMNVGGNLATPLHA